MFKDYIKQVYIEGKQQAIQILNPTFEIKAKDIVNELALYDPTNPKNKYVDLLSKLFLNFYNESIKSTSVKNPADFVILVMKAFKDILENDNI